MVAPGTGDRHLQGATRLGLTSRDDCLHLGGDVAEDQGWIQHPPPGSRRNTTVWGEAEAPPHRSGASGTSLSTPDPQPVGIAGLRHAQGQQDHRQGGRAGVAAV